MFGTLFLITKPHVDVIEDVEKEQEHSSLQEKLDRELRELDKALEQKEVRFLQF